MPVKPSLLSALWCISAALPANAQVVYKCGAGRTLVYSEQPCSNRVVNTDDAPVPVKPRRDSREAVRPQADESTEEFQSRRRRARLTAEARQECEGLDARMPLEQEPMQSTDTQEVLKAKAALGESRERFRKLRC